VTEGQGAKFRIRPVEPDSTWMVFGACAGKPAEWFYDADLARMTERRLAGIARAKAICAGCPVRSDCLAYALTNREDFGVWGGFTADERRVIARREGRAPLSECCVCGATFVGRQYDARYCSRLCRRSRPR
jgi:WhiB family transcriptional regulator, redox-sensing transcriptional regulator